MDVLFDQRRRYDHKIKRANETMFEFIDRCAWPGFDALRQFFRDELVAFPGEHSGQLAQRLRRGEDHDFHSAVFELLLWGGLRRRGFDLEPHPDLPSGTTRQPDFQVTTPRGERFYLEARLAREWLDNKDAGADKRREALIDELNKAEHPDFFLWWSDEGPFPSAPSGRKLRHEVLAWLGSLDYDEVMVKKNQYGHDSCPTMRWPFEEEAAWQVTLKAIPYEAHQRNTGGPLVGIGPEGSGTTDISGSLRRALIKKATAYGQLELPLIVAVNLCTPFAKRMDEVHALYGDGVIYPVGATSADIPEGCSGLWQCGHIPKHQTLSGAWIFRNLEPFNRHDACSTLYPNPWARHPVPTDMRQFPHALVADRRITWNEQAPFGSAFNIAE